MLITNREVRQNMKKCDTCNKLGYIFTYNDKNKKDEIQKCDECNIFKTDKHAEWYVIFNNYNRC